MDKHEKAKQYSLEIKVRTVRIFLQCRPDHPTLCPAVASIGQKRSRMPQTVLKRVRKHGVNAGLRVGARNPERERINSLEHEVQALRSKAYLFYHL